MHPGTKQGRSKHAAALGICLYVLNGKHFSSSSEGLDLFYQTFIRKFPAGADPVLDHFPFVLASCCLIKETWVHNAWSTNRIKRLWQDFAVTPVVQKWPLAVLYSAVTSSADIDSTGTANFHLNSIKPLNENINGTVMSLVWHRAIYSAFLFKLRRRNLYHNLLWSCLLSPQRRS